MFILACILFFIVCILIFRVNSSLNILEFLTVVLVLFIILCYLFYLDHVNKEKFSDQSRLKHVFSTKPDKKRKAKKKKDMYDKHTIQASSFVDNLKSSLRKNQTGTLNDVHELEFDAFTENDELESKSELVEYPGHEFNQPKLDIKSNNSNTQHHKHNKEYIEKQKEKSKNKKNKKKNEKERVGEEVSEEVSDEYMNDFKKHLQVNEECPCDRIDTECTLSEKFKKACKDKWKGYVHSNTWKKLSNITDRLNNDMLPSIKKLSERADIFGSSAEGTNTEVDENEAMVIDPFYVQSNKHIYIPLGVLDKDFQPSKNELEVDINKINLTKLKQISDRVDKLNKVLFSIKEYTPDFYDMLLKTYSPQK